MPSAVAPRSRAARIATLALLMRPAEIVAERVVASATSGGYSFAADSISRLGEVGCSEAFCSPRHDLMNGTFVGIGVLLVGGAGLLRAPFGPWATGLLVVSGISSVATGLAPLDQDAARHALAATPLFAAQPVALVALGARMRTRRSRLARAFGLTGAVTAAAAVGFVLSGEQSSWNGALERLSLWPVLLALPVAAHVLRGDAHERPTVPGADLSRG